MTLITVERDSAQHRRLKLAGLAVLAIVAIAVPFLFGPFRVSQFTLALIYAVAVLGLNLLVGYSGRSRSAMGRSSRSGPTPARSCSTGRGSRTCSPSPPPASRASSPAWPSASRRCGCAASISRS